MNTQTPLIILPGWTGSHETWADFVAFAKKHDLNCTVIDLPCFGSEPCPKNVWGVEEYAEFVHKKISKYNGNCIVLGHSFGGQVAVQMLSKHPKACKKLILSGAAVVRTSKTLKKRIFKVISTIGKWIFWMPILSKHKTKAQKVLYKAADSPDYLKTQGVERDIFKKVITQDLTHLLPNIKTETLVVWGTKDKHTPLSHGKRIAKNLPNAQMITVPGGTHGLHIKKKQELLDAITSFI